MSDFISCDLTCLDVSLQKALAIETAAKPSCVVAGGPVPPLSINRVI